MSGGEPGLLALETTRLGLGDTWEVSDTEPKSLGVDLVGAYASYCSSCDLIRLVGLPLPFTGVERLSSILWDNARKSPAVNLFQGCGSKGLLLQTSSWFLLAIKTAKLTR